VHAWQPVVVAQCLIAVVLKAASVYLHKTDFPRAYRLVTKADFARMKQGKRIRVAGLNLVIAPNDCNHARLGLAVSGKYGNAVQRTRLKRCLRSAFRQHPIRQIHMDILAIPSPQLKKDNISEQSMSACFDSLAKRCNI